MISRIDNEGAVQMAHPTGNVVSDKDLQQAAPVQKVVVKVEQNLGNGREMPVGQAKTMVESMNNFLLSANSELKFVLHDDLNEYYVTIINPETDEVIREVPSKKLMDIHAAMREFVGLLVDRKI